MVYTTGSGRADSQRCWLLLELKCYLRGWLELELVQEVMEVQTKYSQDDLE